MTLQWQQSVPPVTIGGSITNVIDPKHLQVSSVNHALGGTAGVALVMIPLLRPSQVPAFDATVDITIDLDGNRIFSGWLVESKYGEDSASFRCDLTFYDEREYLAQAYMGDPAFTAEWDKVGSDIVFNKGGRPDMKDGEWARNEEGAAYWSINDILNYLSLWVERFTNMSLPEDTFKDADGSDGYPGEVNLAGMDIAAAIDQVVGLLGAETWALDYTTGEITRVSLDEMPATRPIGYMTHSAEDDENPPGVWTAPTWDISITGQRAKDRVVAVSGPTRVESTWSILDSTLIKDDAYKSAAFALRYEVNPSAYTGDLGAPQASDGQGKEWTTNMVTKKKRIGNAYITAAENQAKPNDGIKLSDRDTIWVQEVTDGIQDQPDMPYLRLTGGYELEEFPPAILLEPEITGQFGEGAEETVIAVPAGVYDVRLTIPTQVETQEWAEDEDTSSPYPFNRTLFEERDDQKPLVRSQAVLPDLAGSLIDTVTVNDTYYTAQDTLDELVRQRRKAGKRTYRELVANLEYPLWDLRLGYEIQFVPSAGSPLIDPATDPLICVGLDWYFEDQQKVVVRAVNQLGSDYRKMRPSTSRELGAWRYRNQMESNVRVFEARQAAKDTKEAQRPEQARQSGMAGVQAVRQNFFGPLGGGS